MKRFNRLTDLDIRTYVLPDLMQAFPKHEDNFLIEELGLFKGTTRVDIAVLNGKFWGFEIKSDADSLVRLKNQAQSYNKIFDYMTIYVGAKYAHKIHMHIPKWWEIRKIEYAHDGLIKCSRIRKGKLNKKIDSRAIVQLLWKDEALTLLEAKKLEKGYKSKSKDIIWEHIVNNFSTKEIKSFVKYILMNREEWRTVLPST